MGKLSLNKFTIMELDNSSSITVSNKKEETIGHDDVICVSTSEMEVPKDRVTDYPLTQCQ